MKMFKSSHPERKRGTRLFILMVVTAVSFILVGCGVSKDEHKETLSKLYETKARLERANAKIAQLEKSLSQTQEQLKTAMNKPTREAPETGNQLEAAQQETKKLAEQVKALKDENGRLQGLLSNWKEKFASLEEKVKALQERATDLKSGLLKR